MEETKPLTPQEIATILRVAKSTVYELIKRGELKSYKVGKKIRVDSNDIEEYKTKSKTTASPISTLILNRKDSFCDMDKIQNASFVICGQDIILDILARYLERQSQIIHINRSYADSYNGLFSLYHGSINALAVNIWDMETNQYNIPHVKKMLPGISYTIIHLAERLQGFYVQKGNPKNINDWKDFKRQDLIMVNREKGSGTRILLDEYLKHLNIPTDKINGYTRECSSDLSVASIIARGGADLALGSENTAFQVGGVDFIPLQKEKYELVIRNETATTPHCKKIIEILRSEEFQMELEAIGGYDLTHIGDVIYNS